MALVTISADKHHLVNPHGESFFALGVNYTGYFDRAWKMWEGSLYDSQLIGHDLRKAKYSGFNLIRLFVHSALIEDIRRNNFAKLDEALSLAQDHDLGVLLTLNDAHSLNLGGIGEVDAKIAARYKDVPTVYGYDLENEPVFYNLVAAVYPQEYHPPVQTSRLVDHYGVRVKREEVPDLQRQRRIPGHLDQETAFYYINALRLFLEYDADLNIFVRSGQGTLIDFMLSPQAERWYELIEVLDKTVEAWLKARIAPIRAVGCKQLLTVGWNWLHFGGLPANRLLDFQEYHAFPELSLVGLNILINNLKSLRRAFPQHPVLLGEFGWSNQTGQTTGSSQPVHPKLTGLYEAAIIAYLRAEGFAGGFKWMLNDVAASSNPREANFGVFSVGDVAKPIGDFTQRLGPAWTDVAQPAGFTLLREVGAGFAYRFDLPGQIYIGGYLYQDEAMNWRGNGVAHCFIALFDREVVVESIGGGRLLFDPWTLVPGWDRQRKTDVYRVYDNTSRSRLQTFEVGQSVVFEVQPGVQYAITPGAKAGVQPPPDDAPKYDPQPGEHVLLLGDFETYLPSSLNYIRRFAPDFTFAVTEVVGRWAYVTVIARPQQVSDEVLDDIRSAGAVLVERAVGDSAAETKAILDELASRGQRFLTAFAPIPPQEEPPLEIAGRAVAAAVELSDTYIVQPGDTLSRIARQTYGDARLWPLLYEANKDKLLDPHSLRVGMELHLPEQVISAP